MITITKAIIKKFGLREIVGEHATLTLRATNWIGEKMNIPVDKMDKKTYIALEKIEDILLRSAIDIQVILSEIL